MAPLASVANLVTSMTQLYCHISLHSSFDIINYYIKLVSSSAKVTSAKTEQPLWQSQPIDVTPGLVR